MAPVSGMYFGAGPGFPEEAAVSTRRIAAFDAAAGRPAVWTYFGQWWSHRLEFPEQHVRTVWRAGKIPFIRLNPYRTQPFPDTDLPGSYPGEITVDDIAAGRYDVQLRGWARAARATEIPILLEFGTEVNNFFPWSGINNGAGTTATYGDPFWPDGPERFRDAYRRLVTLFREEGATNVTWFFHADTVYWWAPQQWNELRWYYPGDDYVDWLGLSLYAAPIKTGGAVTTFAEKLQTFHQPGYAGSYVEVTSLGSRPLALLEVGFNNVQGEQLRSEWIRDASATLRSERFGRLKAFSWYVIDSGPFESTPKSSPEFNAAFRDAFANQYFSPFPSFTGNCLPAAPQGAKRKRGRVRWRAVPNAVSYEIWRGASRVGTTSKTSFRMSGGRPLRIRAVNPLGRGPFASVR